MTGLVAGALNIGNLGPYLPMAVSGSGSGNSVNNGGGLGMGGGGTAEIRGCCCLVHAIHCMDFAGPPPPRDYCAEYNYRVSTLGQDPCKEENHRLLCDCIAHGCNPGNVRGCVPNPYEQFHHCGCEKFGGLDPWKGTCCNCTPGKIVGGGDGSSRGHVGGGGGCAGCGGGGGGPQWSPTDGGGGTPTQGGGGVPPISKKRDCFNLVKNARKAVVVQLIEELAGRGKQCCVLTRDEITRLLNCLQGVPINYYPGNKDEPSDAHIWLCFDDEGLCSGCASVKPGHITCSFHSLSHPITYICCHKGCPASPYAKSATSQMCTMADSLVHECWHWVLENAGMGYGSPDSAQVQQRISAWLDCWCN
jgi:hypothetical protein